MDSCYFSWRYINLVIKYQNERLTERMNEQYVRRPGFSYGVYLTYIRPKSKCCSKTNVFSTLQITALPTVNQHLPVEADEGIYSIN